MSDLRNVTLEMSLKPFRSMEPRYIRSVCREVFEQWAPLLRHAREASVMLWTADGSEILEYTGDLDAPIEWARYIGIANEPVKPLPWDPEGVTLHSRHVLYMDSPPDIRYRDLRTIVTALKEEGRRVTGLPVRVGATFDPGPEFARSPFKYERHPEICLARTMGREHGGFVVCYARLHAEDRAYAGFPDGVPEGLSLGTFLGRQARYFLRDLGFDYIWFSNGFGFGRETWSTLGEIFDGERFHAGRVGGTARAILQFWKDFREECPDFRIETRGTNLTTGVDLSTDACPLAEIYRGGFHMDPPPNSPWAALDGDFGLELTGYMSHIAEIPDEQRGYPFRFYTHDPWWLNSPWRDRYGRSPHDIYLPLSVGRVAPDGQVRSPAAVEFLTIDDSRGRMPDSVPNEVTPHILAALHDAPDAPGPTVWVYPFEEYHDMTFGPKARLEEVFFGDWFIRTAINRGFPLNTVVSSGILRRLDETALDRFRSSILVSRVPDAGSDLDAFLVKWLDTGGRVLLYGPVHSPALAGLLGIASSGPLEGEFRLDGDVVVDEWRGQGPPPVIRHRGIVSGGGIREVEGAVPPGAEALWQVTAVHAESGARRVVARAVRLERGGMAAWVRGTNPFTCPPGSRLPRPDAPDEVYDAGGLMRVALRYFGFELCASNLPVHERPPLITLARSRNGLFLSGYWRDTSVKLRARFPWGAPAPVGMNAVLENGGTVLGGRRWEHLECRVFVDGMSEGVVACEERHSGDPRFRRRLFVSGLRNAVVRFLPEPGTEENLQVLTGRVVYPYTQAEPVRFDVHRNAEGALVEVQGVTGDLLFSW